MAEDIAYLGFDIDSTQAVVATRNLNDMNAAAGRADVGANKLSTSTGKMASVMRGGGFRNFAMQMNQVGQQTAATGNFMQALSIQLPDILLGFGTMGIVAGALAPLLFNVAAGFLGGAESADDLKKTIKALDDAFNEYQKSAEAASMSTKALYENYGTASETLRSTLDLLNEIAKSEAQDALDNAAQSLSDILGIAGAGEARGAVADFFNVDIWFAISKEARATREIARQLTGEFVSAQNALVEGKGNAEAQRDALVRMLEAAKALADADGERSTEENAILKSIAEQLKIAEQMVGSVNAVTGQTSEWAVTMSGVRVEIESIMSTLARIGGGAISNAAKQAEIDALKAGKSIKEAAQQAVIFQKTLEFDTKKQGANWFERQAIDAEEFQFRHGLALDAVLDKERELAREREKAAGGGAKRDLALETIIGKFDEDPYYEVELWHKKALQALTDAQLIERGMLDQHNSYKLQIEQNYQQQLAAIRAQEKAQTLSHYGDLFGNMATLFESGGKKTFALAKAFSVAQGLMNSYRAYTEVLADPSLIGRPFLRQALAASTLAAGLAQVASMRSTNFGSSGGSSAPTGASSGGAAPTPERIVRIDFNGPAWARDLVEGLATQLFEASEDGARVIFSR